MPDTASAPEREALPVELDREGMVPILVLEGDSLQPVLGAEVHANPASRLVTSWRKGTYAGRTSLPVEELRSGEATVTDAEGVAWIPRPSDGCLLTAWHGDRAGRAEVQGDGDAYTVLLFPDPPIVIDARHPEGHPLEDMEVGILQGGGYGSPVLTTRTDASGKAILIAPRLHFREPPVGGYRIGLRQLVVPDRGSVAFENLAREVTLTATPSSHVRLELQDLLGAPYSAPVQIRLLHKRGRYHQTSLTASPADGVVLLPPLPLDAEIKVEIDLDGRYPNDDLEVTIHSPRRVDGMHTEVIAIPRIYRSLPVHVQVPEAWSMPPSNQVLTLAPADGEGRPISRFQAGLDADGKGTLHFGVGENDLDASLHLDVVLRQAPGASFLVGRSEPFTLPREEELSIPLRSREGVLNGRILDADGQPVSGGFVKVFELREGGSLSTYGRSSTMTDDTGRYVVLGKKLGAGSVVRAHYRGRRFEEQVVVEGVATYDFRLPPMPYRITGRLTLPDYLHKGATLVFEQDGKESWQDFKGPIVDYPFTFRLMDAGPGRLSLRRHPTEEFAALEDLVPWGEGEPGDSRLEAWDLSSSFPLASVDLRLGAERIKEFSIDRSGSMADLRPSRFDSLYFPENSLRVRTPSGTRFLLLDGDPTRVLISGPRMQPMEVDLREGHQVLQVIPGALGTFRLSGIDAVPEGMDLVCYATPLDENSIDMRSETILRKELDFSRSFQKAGSWKFTAYLYRKGYWGGCTLPYSGEALTLNGEGREYTFSVPADMGNLEVEVQLDADQVAAITDRYLR